MRIVAISMPDEFYEKVWIKIPKYERSKKLRAALQGLEYTANADKDEEVAEINMKELDKEVRQVQKDRNMILYISAYSHKNEKEQLLKMSAAGAPESEKKYVRKTWAYQRKLGREKIKILEKSLPKGIRLEPLSGKNYQYEARLFPPKTPAMPYEDWLKIQGGM